MRSKYNGLELTGLICIGIVLLAAGCNRPAAPVNANPPSTLPVTSPPPVADGNTIAPPVAVAAAIHNNSSLFPKGTELLSLVVKNHVASLDFNAAFSGLANMGDTTESKAQKQLRAALAKYPDIEKMNVTVNGKPFDSQATDWTTPFPVRQTDEEKSASRGNE